MMKPAQVLKVPPLVKNFQEFKPFILLFMGIL